MAAEMRDRKVAPKLVRCKGEIVGEHRHGKSCPFHSAEDGYCRRHHPKKLILAARNQVAILRLRLRLAQQRLARLEAKAAA